MTQIVRGHIEPLRAMGFPVSAAVTLASGVKLYAVHDVGRSRIVVLARPAATGDMKSLVLEPRVAAGAPSAGDLLDALIDPAHADTISTAETLAQQGVL